MMLCFPWTVCLLQVSGCSKCSFSTLLNTRFGGYCAAIYFGGGVGEPGDIPPTCFPPHLNITIILFVCVVSEATRSSLGGRKFKIFKGEHTPRPPSLSEYVTACYNFLLLMKNPVQKPAVNAHYLWSQMPSVTQCIIQFYPVSIHKWISDWTYLSVVIIVYTKITRYFFQNDTKLYIVEMEKT